MPDPSIIQTVAVVGTGLIGGSFSLGLRKAGFTGTILGVDEPAYIQSAVKIGAIDRISTLADAAASADLIYLSGTVDNILANIDHLEAVVRPGCLVTDVGSTKRSIVSRAALRLQSAVFVGGHPMAGKEKRGAENADPDLFRDRPYILTSLPQSAVFKSFSYWLERMGARIVQMDVNEHDETVAFSSHLPQLVSTALAYTLASQGDLPIDSVFGSGLTDMTRLAQSAPELWKSILETNSDQVISALDCYIATLNEIRNRLSNSELDYIFKAANTYAYQLRKRS